MKLYCNTQTTDNVVKLIFWTSI